MNADELLRLPPLGPTEDLDPCEDLAASFIEEFVGHRDWANNWKQLKEQGVALPRVRNWVAFHQLDVSPEVLFKCVDALFHKHGGSKWR